MFLKVANVMALLVIGASATPASGDPAAILVRETEQGKARAVAASNVGGQVEVHRPRLEARYPPDERQFMCGYCGERFWTSADLARHINSKKGDTRASPTKNTNGGETSLAYRTRQLRIAARAAVLLSTHSSD
ncbi:hypothetical protein PspLS_11416 [Pyricularia sp. CBS 133598]|nr:hypothetical protein PspLS_11416 [Pyricularia sp. CBS 133598]